MSYIGLSPRQQLLNTSTQFFSGDGSTLEFILARSVASASDLDIIIDNDAQRPFVEYTANNLSLRFITPPPVGLNNITVTYRAGALNSLNLEIDAFSAGTVGEPAVYSVAANNTGFYWPAAGTIATTINGANRLFFSGNIDSTSTTTGALQVLGGVGITGNTNVGGILNISNSEPSISIDSGAVTVSGGAGIVGNLNVGGDITCVGAFTVNGTFTTTAADALVVADPFVFLANANPGDTFDTGIVAQYNDGVERYAGYYRDVSNKKFKFFSNLTARPTTTVNSNDPSFALADLELNTLSATGNVEATFFFGDGSQLTGISTDANKFFNGNSEVIIPSINGPIVSNVNNITISTISSTGLAVTGLISATGNINAVGNVFGGNLSAAGLITATGNVVSAGNVSGGNIITGGAVIATANITGGNITTTGIVTAGGNVTGGNIRTNGLISATGDVFGNNFTATTAVNASGNITGANFFTAGQISSGGNIIGALGSINGNLSAGNISTVGQISASGNVSGATGAFTTVTGNGRALTSLNATNLDTGTVPAARLSGTYTITVSSATTAGTVTTAAQPNITSVGTLTALAVTGNITSGNVSGATGAFTTVTGNGRALTSLNASNMDTGTLPAARLSGTYTITVSGSATTAGTVTTAAQPNITSVGTLTSLSASGNITATANVAGGNILATSLVRGTTVSATGNVIGANTQSGTLSLSGNILSALNSTSQIQTTANITGGNIITSGLLTVTGAVTGGSLTTSGAVTGGSFTGNGSALSALNGSNISTGTVAAARIDNLDADKITTGIFADARIPNLNASKITAGTLPVARGGTGVTTSTGTGAVVLGTSPTFTTGITTPAITKSGTNAVGNIGQTDNRFNTIFARATSASYADLAEVYAADGEYEPGTVVVFGGDNEVTQSQALGDHRVAGVISTNPAHVMNSSLDTKFPAVVGLTGRVPTKVIGPVVKGDLMVTSLNGYAQACSSPMVGTVLGKSLENFNGNHGVIEIAVGRM